MGKKGMTKEAARRIQSSQDRKGVKGDMGFKSRAMRAASKKTQKKLFLNYKLQNEKI